MEDPGTVLFGTVVSEGPAVSEGPEATPDAGQLARDLATLADIDEEFGALDLALRRLDDDTYWTCEACGAAIDEAVLVDSPLGRRCALCLPFPG